MMKVYKATGFRMNVTITERSFDEHSSGPTDKEASLTVNTKGKVVISNYKDSFINGGEYRGRKYKVIVQYDKRLLNLKDARLEFDGMTTTISELPYDGELRGRYITITAYEDKL